MDQVQTFCTQHFFLCLLAVTVFVKHWPFIMLVLKLLHPKSQRQITAFTVMM